ncbi:MAG: exonuclease subunit SbcD, partial [Saprospiraceae bacterium]|nr:exonuclease subunit SbcD [Saprospiraceae bacterium]
MDFRILHTADWHLGQKFLNQSRIAEQKAVLDQILRLIENERINLLIIAGDIFDQRNPSISARKLYYDFL